MLLKHAQNQKTTKLNYIDSQSDLESSYVDSSESGSFYDRNQSAVNLYQ